MVTIIYKILFNSLKFCKSNINWFEFSPLRGHKINAAPASAGAFFVLNARESFAFNGRQDKKCQSALLPAAFIL
jgi:hypothetical protein